MLLIVSGYSYIMLLYIHIDSMNLFYAYYISQQFMSTVVGNYRQFMGTALGECSLKVYMVSYIGTCIRSL